MWLVSEYLCLKRPDMIMCYGDQHAPEISHILYISEENKEVI